MMNLCRYLRVSGGCKGKRILKVTMRVDGSSNTDHCAPYNKNA